MLAVDNSIGCIEASESDILVLYRSLEAPFVAGGRSEFREAYVCAIRKAAKVSTYLALIADNGRIVVYTKPGEPDSEEGYLATVDEALSFAKSLGFAPELVNLNYSAAMREVVVRNIRILRPPASRIDPLLKNGTADAPTPAGAAKTVPEKPAQAAFSPAPARVSSAAVAAKMEEDEVKILRSSLSNLKVECSLVAAERDVLSLKVQELSNRQQSTEKDLAKARKAAADSASELTAMKQDVAPLMLQLQEVTVKSQEGAARNAALETALARVTSERDAALHTSEQLAEENKQGALETKRLGEELAALGRQRTEGLQRIAALERQCRESEEQLCAARAELSSEAERLHAELAETLQRGEAGLAALIQERDAALRRVEKLSEEKREAHRELDKLHAELAALSAEKEETLLAKETLQLHCQDLVSEVAAANAATAAAREAAEKAHEAAAARSVGETHAAESAQADAKALAQAKAKAEAKAEADAKAPKNAKALKEANPLKEAGAQAEANAQAEEKAEADANALAADKEATVGRIADVPAPEPQATGGAAEVSSASAEPCLAETGGTPIEDDQAEVLQHLPLVEVAAPDKLTVAAAPVFPLLSEIGNDFFSAAYEDPEVFFLLQDGVAAIEYQDPDEVIQLYRSVNVAYLSPEGKGQESCQGYICCVKSDAAPMVYAALYGVKSGRTYVYGPDRRPADDATYAAAVKGAIAFGEQVGLMMEPENQGMSQQERRAMLANCPVLRNLGRER